MDCALMLGVSQTVLENEYYMVDLPLLIHKKTQKVAEERLVALQIALAPNMKEEGLRQFMDRLRAPLEHDDADDEFDAKALAKLRGRLK